MSRLQSRLHIVPSLLKWSLRPRIKPVAPRRILIAHHLLLGDTLMLTPLLAKLREQYPDAKLYMTMQEVLAPLYGNAPYGVTALPYNPKKPELVGRLLREASFDLALVPGDNRYSWLAYALGARWIVAFAGDRPAYKSWPVDEAIQYPSSPQSWPDMNTRLIQGPAPQSYEPAMWTVPDVDMALPTEPYAVLHVGASSSTKFWSDHSWRSIADRIAARGLKVVWSCGANETALVQKIDPEQRYQSFGGQLNLLQLWKLVANAALMICPDTGVSHIGKHTLTPTLCLYGPGSATLFGYSEFWRKAPFVAMIKPIGCRDQPFLFKRELPWVERCSKPLSACPPRRCMDLITPDDVWQAARKLLEQQAARFSSGAVQDKQDTQL